MTLQLDYIPPKLIRSIVGRKAAYNRLWITKIQICLNKMTEVNQENEPEVITVQNNFQASEGQNLGGKYFLGTKLGQGMQGAVYDVLALSQDLNTKFEHAGLVFKCLNSGQTSEKYGLLREWLINSKINQLSESGDGDVKGFMRAKAGVYRENGKFIGIVLEKMNGWTARKRIKCRDFNDISYICYMLQDVFEALQRSQTLLGFHHADLHLGNIMEQHPIPSKTSLLRTRSKKWTISGLSYRSSDDFQLEQYDLSNIHFKMIDFGHSWFLNQKEQELMQIGLPRQSITLETIDENNNQILNQERSPPHSQLEVDEMKVSDQSREQIRAENGHEHNSKASDNTEKQINIMSDNDEQQNEEFENLQTQHSSRSAKNFNCTQISNLKYQTEQNLENKHNKIPTQNSAILLRTSFTEKVYRLFWAGKGDVYRLLLSLAAQIDGRIWNQNDFQLVEEVAKLIQRILGVQILRKYSENSGSQIYGKQRKKSVKYLSVWYRWYRRIQIRTRSLLAPVQPGILAKDAIILWQQLHQQITQNSD
eukprot:TRINITY_DN21328_c0_g1_i3.p1 TRINITY_DN21328_c0_g1~~TRINITY_DN21328_c0_g1_i3.p1  ORF type:complete len:535 (-),score=46.99 TRINITY_DN21328_c0_g1_i3:500-2104(-)